MSAVIAACALAACAPRHGDPLFAVSRTGPAIAQTTAVDRGGGWWTTTAGQESYHRLTRPRFARLRAVIAAAELAVISQPPCAAAASTETLNVADHERGRFVTYVRPCLVPDPTTERAIACLDEALASSDDRFAQTCGPAP